MEALKRQFTTALFVAGGLAGGATTRMFIETGSKRLKINPRYSADAANCQFTFNENATIGAGGTTPPSTRHNLEDGDTADFTLTQDAAVTAAGTAVMQDISLGLQTRVQWVQKPFMLAPNTTYQFIIQNFTGGVLNPSIEILITQDA